MTDNLNSQLIRVQHEDFNLGALYEWLRCAEGDGAIVTFSGIVRDFNQNGSLAGIELEQYSPMTELALAHLASQAQQRFTINRVAIIHRVGRLSADQQIVFVGVTSQHRLASFDAAQYIMDKLKTDVPLWKKEWVDDNNAQWVAVKQSDVEAAKRWQQSD